MANKTPHINKTQLRDVIEKLTVIRLNALDDAQSGSNPARLREMVVDPLARIINQLQQFVGVILLAGVLVGCTPLS